MMKLDDGSCGSPGQSCTGEAGLLKTLNEKVAKLKSEKAALKAMNEKLAADNNYLQEKLAESTMKRKALDEQVDTLAKELSGVRILQQLDDICSGKTMAEKNAAEVKPTTCG